MSMGSLLAAVLAQHPCACGCLGAGAMDREAVRITWVLVEYSDLCLGRACIRHWYSDTSQPEYPGQEA